MSSAELDAPAAPAAPPMPPVEDADPRPGGPARRFALPPDALRVFGPLVGGIVALSLYTGSRNSIFFSWNNYRNILLQVSVLALLAIGQTFLMAAGQLDLSVAAEAALVGVLSATMLRDGRPEAVVVVVCLALGAAVGLAWGLTVAHLRVPPFILTLGGLSVFRSLASKMSHDVPVPVRGLQWLNSKQVGGLRTPVLVVFVVLVVCALVLRYTRFGRQVYAVGSSEEAAYLAGLPTRRTTVLVFVISSTMAALAGLILVVRVGAGDPTAASGYELQAVAAVVLGGGALAGGRGTPIGTYLGVLLLGVVSASMIFLNVATSLTDLVFGGVLIFAVVANAVGRSRGGRPNDLRAILGRLTRSSRQ